MIESPEDVILFSDLGLNRANCSFCHHPVEAPVRVEVKIPDSVYMDQECIPLELLESPEVVGELVRKLDEGRVIVFSTIELIRSLGARTRVELYHQGLVGTDYGVAPLESHATVANRTFPDAG
jgi:hypothetical protein